MARRSRRRFKVSKPVVNPLIEEGRKSTRKEVADALKRAAAFLFFKYGYSCSFELGLESWGSRRADVIGSKISGAIVIIEIKSSVADFRADDKLKTYLKHCDRFYLCFTKKVWLKVKENETLMEKLPKRAGVIALQEDGYAKIVRPCKIKEMAPENRLAILARLAWRNGELSKRVKRARERVFVND